MSGNRPHELARELSAVLDELGDDRAVLPAKAVGSYVSQKLADGDLDAASLGVEQILNEYSAPLPLAVVQRVGAVASELQHMRASPPPSSAPPSPPSTRPNALVSQRRRRRRRRGSSRESPPLERSTSVGPNPLPPTPAYTEPGPPASYLGVAPTTSLLPAVRPEPPPEAPTSPSGAGGGWLLLGVIGLGIGLASLSDRGKDS